MTTAVLPLTGDVEQIRCSAKLWRTFAAAADTASSDIRRVDSGAFSGDEGDLYRDRLNKDLPPHLDSTSSAWQAVSVALAAYATALETLQQQMNALSVRAADERSQVTDAEGAVADARAADTRHTAAEHMLGLAAAPGTTAPPNSYRSQATVAHAELDTATTALQSTIDAANQLRAQHTAAVDACVTAIDAAAGMRFEEPPGFWGRLGNAVGGWVRGHADVLKSISGVLKQISNIAGLLAMIPVLAPVMAPLAAATGAGAVIIDSAVKVTTGEGSWTDIAMDAAGMFPGGGAAKGVATGARAAHEAEVAVGAGRAVSTASKNSRVFHGVTSDGAGVEGAVAGADRAETALAGADPTARRAVDDAEAAVTHDTPVDDLPCVGDPIDVITGEMVLQQTDLALPGVLPLVMKRVYKSGYRWGGRFGRSWASTLDQRVEIGSGGHVCFVAEDGVVLHYLDAADGAADIGSLPTEGAQRWPLRRFPDGGWTVEDPERRVTRRFAAADEHGCSALIEIVDAHGNSIEFRHGDHGVVTDIRHSGGYRVLVSSEDGLVTGLSVQDGAVDTPVTSFDYDRHAQLVAVRNAEGIPLILQWESGRIVGWRDRNDVWYRYQYDELGRCVRTSGRGRVLSYGFCYLPGRTLVTNSVGGVSTYEYNDACQVVRTVDPMGNATASVWDRFDRLLVRTDPLGFSTQLQYDQNGRVIGTTRPDGVRESVRRDAVGRVVGLVDANGASWFQAYDAAGNLAFAEDPLHAVTRWAYNGRGAVATITDPLGAVTTVRSNRAGLPVSVSDPLGATTQFDYDHLGRPVRSIDPLGGTTSLGWTADGQLSHRISADGTRDEWRWDQEGNLTSHTGPTGATTCIENGIFDLPVTRIEPDGGRLLFGYDTELRLTTVQNAAGLRWRYEYDAAGRLVVETDFNGRTQRYRHDAAGRVVGLVNGLGEETVLTYSSSGDLLERRTVDTVTELSYDRAGQVTGARSPSVAVEFERDARGRIVRESVNGRSTTVEFDAAGQQVSRQTAAGVLSRWQFDATGRPRSLVTAGQRVEFGHDTAGHERTRMFSGGGLLDQRFDVSHRMISQVMATTTAQPAVSPVARSFDYRADGTLAELVNKRTGDRRRIEVDVASRVVGVRAAGWTEGYAYDGSGKLLHATDGHHGDERLGIGESDAEKPRTYSGSLVVEAGSVSYRYDRQGRMVTRTRKRLSRKPETWQFRYDADDRMVAAMSAGQQWTYTYDPFGRRVSKQRLDAEGRVAEQILFSWDRNRMIEQVCAADGAPPVITTWEYLPGSWQPVSQTVGGVDLDAQFYAVVSDLVGAPTELVTPDGRRVAWSNADASVWGAPRRRADNASGKNQPKRLDCPIRFPGQYADEETGLHYNRYRYYDPGVGRFTSSDPLGLAPAPDPYGYVLNPTGWADPLGLTPCRGGAQSSDDRITQLPPSEVRYSQSTVNGAAEIERSMLASGWRGDPIDIVRMPDGGLTTLDNTRVLAAHRADINVEANVHHYSDPIPASVAVRVTSPKSNVPITWGDGVLNRISRQNGRYRRAHPSGSPIIGWDGF